MEKIFKNILGIHHQSEINIIMMIESALSKDFEVNDFEVNIDYCYRKIHLKKDYGYYKKGIYIKKYEFKFKIVDDYIYIEYIDNEILLKNTLYKQCQSISDIKDFINESIKIVRSI